MVKSWEWKEQASCKHTPELFYPRGRIRPLDLYKAKQICSTCPVFKQCAEFAEENGEEYGIWAGKDMSVQRREQLRIRNARRYRKLRNQNNDSG